MGLSVVFGIVRKAIAENLDVIDTNPRLAKVNVASRSIKILLGSFENSQALVDELAKHGLNKNKVMFRDQGSFVEGLIHTGATTAGSVAIVTATAALPGGFVVGLVLALFYLGTMLNRQLRSDFGGYSFVAHQRARFMAWTLRSSKAIYKWLMTLVDWYVRFRAKFPGIPFPGFGAQKDLRSVPGPGTTPLAPLAELTKLNTGKGGPSYGRVRGHGNCRQGTATAPTHTWVELRPTKCRKRPSQKAQRPREGQARP